MGHLSLEKPVEYSDKSFGDILCSLPTPYSKTYIYEYHGLDNYAKPEQRDLIS